MTNTIDRDALAYHLADPRGKLQVLPSKPMATQYDLSLAYSPGVAAPCLEIAEDPLKASDYTMRGNLVAVISNGTAVLGLGNIGPLASKPVMEGKAALFKKFSGIDVFDIEVDASDVEAFCNAVRPLEPTFGGINLEDIKAPECFAIEKRLRAEMNIPVFHDDQHGTAIVTAAAVLNSLELVGKTMEDVKIAANGAGAASIACLELLVAFGAKRDNIIVCDSSGAIYKDRPGRPMDETKLRFAGETDVRTLEDAMVGADIFLGLSVAGSVTKDMVKSMAANPVVLAMANPEPEIRPEVVAEVRDDAICATGRSDYPNQVNNVLCFPFIFRGALDVGATEINENMKIACARAIASMARKEASDVVLSAYGADNLQFGRDYVIPKPFDPRLISEIAPAVAKAAMESGVATRPIEDMEAYTEKLEGFVYRSGMLMKPVFDQAVAEPKSVVFAEGDSSRVLHAAQQAVQTGVAKPVLIGSEQVIQDSIRELGLSIQIGSDVRVIDPNVIDASSYAEVVHHSVGRSGISPKEALNGIRRDPSVLAMAMLKKGEVDAAICGTNGRFGHHLTRLEGLIGRDDGVSELSTLNALVLPTGTVFVADTYVSPDPTAEEIVELTTLAAAALRKLGIEPKVALVSHSNFGDRPSSSSRKMRRATEVLRARNVDFEFDGELHVDAAMSEELRAASLPSSSLKGAANLLIMPNIDAAHISFNLLKTMGNGVSVGPIMLGAAKPIHIVSQSITVRGLLNMTAIAVVDAQSRA